MFLLVTCSAPVFFFCFRLFCSSFFSSAPPTPPWGSSTVKFLLEQLILFGTQSSSSSTFVRFPDKGLICPQSSFAGVVRFLSLQLALGNLRPALGRSVRPATAPGRPWLGCQWYGWLWVGRRDHYTNAGCA